MGKEIDQGLKQEYGIYDNPKLNAYVAEVGQKLAPLTHRPHLKYHFAVLDTPVENAFAAPGGYIYITRGLMAMMSSEAELASVLGHELGHVSARHSIRSMSRATLLTIGLAVASGLSKKIRNIAPVAQVATQLLFLKYSRKDEYQADALGIEYSSKAGYQSGEMIGFFNSIQRLSQEHGGGRLPNFLSTHPLTPRRIQRAQEIINGPGYPKTTLLVARNAYLNKINGMVYGNNPRQGYVEGNAFYHPVMRFYFTIPPKWKVQNTPTKVTLTSPDGKAIMMLTAGPTTMDLNNHVNEQLKKLSKFNVLSEGFVNINGLRAFNKLVRTVFEQSSGQQNQQQDVNVRLTGIKKGNNVISFFAASQTTDYPNYRQVIRNSIRSFNNLTDIKYLRRRPKRVVVRQVGAQQTLSRFLQALKVPEKLWKRIALLNAAQLDTVLIPKKLVKVIR
ncbi:MAG: M48 family metalloprotease, partial [Candidatus Aminicenantes bacterium]|nr:M48 family metalloprotease [Candidatus Aminicenantes bacterium]